MVSGNVHCGFAWLYICIHVLCNKTVICEMLLLGCQGYIHKIWLSPCEVYNHQFHQYCIWWELNWYFLSFFKFTLEWKLIQSFVNLMILILMIWNSYSLLESIWKHQIMIDSLLVCWWYWTESIAGYLLRYDSTPEVL